MTDKEILEYTVRTLEEILTMMNDPDSDEYFTHASIEHRINRLLGRIGLRISTDISDVDQNGEYLDVSVYLKKSHGEWKRVRSYDLQANAYFDGAWQFSPDDDTGFEETRDVPEEIMLAYEKARPEADDKIVIMLRGDV